jgi:hypothetical protein
MHRKILEIKTLPNYELLAKFDNGETKHYDVAKLFDQNQIFQPLKRFPQLFPQVTLAPQGYAAVWNDDIDIAADELYLNGY